MATAAHVLLTSDGNVIAFDKLGARLTELEGPRGEVRERLLSSLSKNCTIERQVEDGSYQRASRWNI